MRRFASNIQHSFAGCAQAEAACTKGGLRCPLAGGAIAAGGRFAALRIRRSIFTVKVPDSRPASQDHA